MMSYYFLCKKPFWNSLNFRLEILLFCGISKNLPFSKFKFYLFRIRMFNRAVLISESQKLLHVGKRVYI